MEWKSHVVLESEERIADQIIEKIKDCSNPAEAKKLANTLIDVVALDICSIVHAKFRELK